ncbi:MAG TPA: HPF/RaiA family ribosome-associated protein [Burkholderiales bacterium]
MELAPEIIFHDLDRAEWIEAYVLERLRHLERFARGITRCRVTLARESAKSSGNRYSALVEVRVPPQHDLAVRKQKDIVDMAPQMRALINLAFAAIQRQVKKTAALRRGEEKLHDRQPHGVVEKLFSEGYGFIRTFDDRQFYFHRNSVLHDDFERLSLGTEVRFSPELGDEGPQASSVQIVAKPPSV